MECLITKLKGSVNDNSLPKLGEMVIDNIRYETNGDVLSLNISPRESGVKLRVSGAGVYFISNQESTHLTELELPASDDILKTSVRIYNPSLSEMKAFLTKKGVIKNFRFNKDSNAAFPLHLINQLTTMERFGLDSDYHIENGIYGDISVFKKFSRLQQIYLYSSGVYGDISAFKGMTNLKKLVISSCGITGDISNLGSAISCTYFNFADTQVSGTLEEFCQLLHDNGLTSGNITVKFQNSQVTFGGKPLISGKIVTFNSSGYVVG